VLVIAEMYRPRWRASSSGAALETEPFAGGLLAVRVPPGTAAVRVAYRRWPLIAATVLAWSVVLGCIVLLCAPLVRRTP
jgi:hypothetical protein